MMIAQKSIDPDQFFDPIGYIRSEHDRQLRLCDRIDRLVRERRPGALRQEAQALLAYLTEELPLHCRDEEEDLFRLLRRACLPEDRIETVLSELDRDHATELFLGHHVVAQLKALDGRRPVPDETRLYRDLLAFAESQRRHLEWENTVVLPLARKRLSAADLAEMGRNMAARRRAAKPLRLALCA